MTRFEAVPPRFLLGGLVSAAVLAAYLVTARGPAALAIPGLGLIIVVVLAALTRQIPGSGLIAAAVAAILYAGFSYLSTSLDELRIGAAIIGVVGFGLVGVFADLLASRLFELSSNLAQAGDLIEELTVRDATTGTVKPQYVRQVLAEEIQRAQRYRRPVSVLMIGLDQSQPPPAGVDLDEVFGRVGRALADRLRQTDKVSFLGDPPRFLCLLTETPLDGGKLVAERLIEEIRASTGVQFYSGLASFPDDAVDADGLVQEARSAFEFAMLTGEALAHRDLLKVET